MRSAFFILICLVFAAGTLAQDPVFVDGSELAGIAGTTTSNYSVAIVDIDQDGWEDVYIGSKNEPNKMFRNSGDGSFTDIANELGLDCIGNTTTSLWADFDNDGDPDGFVANYGGANNYFINLGNGVFVDIAEELGIAGDGNTRCAVTADVNSDGFLDIYVVNLNMPNEFYLSDGQGGFVDHYLASGALDALVGMGAVFFDSDNDGDQDLYLLHDAYQANKFYINDGQGHFTNQASILGADHEGEGMGVDVIDFNHDGWFDIYITNNIDGNNLLVNNGDGSYTDLTEIAGVGDMGMGWGVSWTDFNLDGHSDLYMANNHVFSPYVNVLYQNNGDSTFTQVGQGSVLDSPYVGAGIATADLDQNGTEDILVANSLNINSPGVQLFWNQTIGNSWISIDLRGVNSNRDAIGSVVTVYSDSLVQKDVVLGGSGYSQMNSKRLHFGLGELTSVDSVEVRWPNGIVEVFTELVINQVNILQESTLTSDVLNGDLNGDGVVNMFDLLLFLQYFGCNGTDCGGDFVEDDMINVSDLLYFLQVFSP
jgi:hypothetical protein